MPIHIQLIDMSFVPQSQAGGLNKMTKKTTPEYKIIKQRNRRAANNNKGAVIGGAPFASPLAAATPARPWF